ncbi:FtsX-like permease family protein [Nocardioides zhouii]|uniref:FtsX-like permease family protein n=1 Tax=Nocardioides zhouii TaxID=1168729 RepID=A0A4V1RNV2_9ACTN|nr:FtsX-like permease family protein [Nocardioides zhouii]RYC07147.1 FtsX-like permease family protein [Nocardioides zhouii]
MRRPQGIHLPTLTGRARSDWAVLLLMGLVAMLTVALTAAVAPATERAADRAIAAAVADAGPRGAVVATLPEWYDDPRGKTRDPSTAVQVRQDTDYAFSAMPPELARVLRPGVTSVTTPALQLLDAGTGRFLQLAYVDTAGAPPAVTWAEGGAPRASTDVGDGTSGDEPWPVQVAVSQEVADALGVRVGDRLPAKDEFGRTLTIEVSGTFVPVDEGDAAWQVSPRMLQPVVGTADGLPFSSGAALVSAESLPDLRFALPGDDLTRHVVFTPEPSRVRWRQAEVLERSIVSLQSSAALASGEISWDSQLGSVLQQGRAQVASARGQAQVLVVGLVSCALLVLVLGAQLLVVRRESTLSMVRQRGASLPGIALELVVEALPVAGVATLLGLGAARVLGGSGGWGWSVAVLLVASTAPALLGAAAAARVGDARRAPANRIARRAAARSRRLRRLALEGAVLAAAVLSYTALQQRGVVEPDSPGGDVTASSAPVWWAVVGAVVLLRLLPPLLTWALGLARRSTGSVAFVATARLLQTATRVLPVVVTVVAMAGITLGLALTGTVRQGQADGALSAVGGDARIDAEPDDGLLDLAHDLEDATGVRAAAAGRVEEGVRVSSARGVEVVRLVVVDSAAYERLLLASDLAEAPGLGRLRSPAAGPAPALVRGGDARLVGDLDVTWEEADVPLTVVGTAPDVGAPARAVVVVDAEAFAVAGGVAPPNTVWAVGPGSSAAVAAAAPEVPESSVATYADELRTRRDAPLPSVLVALALVSSAVLLALAILAAVLAAVVGAPARAAALGRLRALGLPTRDVWRLLVVELALPVAVAAIAGSAVGAAGAHAVLGSLSLELVTGQPGTPSLVVPWWSGLAVLVLLAAVVVVAALELRSVLRRPLGEVLRA